MGAIVLKTCGIVGGMGPEATALFYMKVIKQFKNTKGYPPVLIYSVPELFQVANSFLKLNQEGHQLQELVIQGIQMVHNKVDFCVIPCNTAHIYIKEIREVSKVPVFSIVEETYTHLRMCNRKRVGIVATTATIQSQLYTRPFYENNIIPILPLTCQQVTIAEIIVRIVKGQVKKTDQATLVTIIESLQQRGAECVLLACTDLPILVSQRDTNIPLIDTMDILAQVAANVIKGKVAIRGKTNML